MRVALTVADFLNRGAGVYGSRSAVIDEPDVPGSLGTVTYTELEARARGMARGLDHLGVAHGERVAIVSPNSARFLTSYFGVSGYGRILVPINFRLSSAEIAYIVEHSGASVLLYDPDLTDVVADIPVAHRFALDGVEDAELFAAAPEGAQAREWEGDEDASCSVNYTSGTTARPKGVQLTHRNCWINAVTFGWHTGVSDRDVLMHTLPMFHCNGWGMPYAVTGMGGLHVVVRKIDGEEILSRVERHGVTLLCGAPAVVAAILDAATTRAREGRAVPGGGTVRIVVAGAPPPSKAIERVETELGWEFLQIYGLTETSPLLTINRAPAEWDAVGAVERSQRLSRAGVPAIGVQIAISGEDEVLARSNHVFAGYWEQPEEIGESARWRVVPHRRRRLSGRGLPRHLRPQEGCHHHRRRERLLHRGGGLPLPASRRGGGRGHRRPARKMGGDGQGPRGPPARCSMRRRATSSRTAVSTWPISRPPRAWSSAPRSTARRPASCRSTNCASPTGRTVNGP